MSTSGLCTLLSDTVRRFAPLRSQYLESAAKLHDPTPAAHPQTPSRLRGVLIALRTAYSKDLLSDFAELVHADLFADFLEMAEHLHGEGYKDAAAVIAGSSLEEHLRQLCGKHSISVVREGKPKKADEMNADLTKADVYQKLEQKSVTAWLDLRNKAAHGKYSEYDAQQVSHLIEGIRHFMTRNPA